MPPALIRDQVRATTLTLTGSPDGLARPAASAFAACIATAVLLGAFTGSVSTKTSGSSLFSESDMAYA